MAPHRPVALWLAAAACLLGGMAGPAGPAHAAGVQQPPADGQSRPGLTLDLPSPEEARQADASRGTAPLGSAPEVAVETPAERDARLAAEAEALRVREANAGQLAAAEADSRRIAADRQAQEAQLALYREQQAAHAQALATYADQLARAEEARRRWKADVAACRAGDYSRCAAVEPVR